MSLRAADFDNCGFNGRLAQRRRALRSANFALGRAVLHLLCAFRSGHWRAHSQGVARELSSLGHNRLATGGGISRPLGGKCRID